MAEFKNGAYEPGTYVKGDAARVAKTPAEAVKLVWEGFVRQDDSKPEAEKPETPAEPEAEKPETPAEPEAEKPEIPAEPEAEKPEIPAEPAVEKRGPGRPRKPVVEDK